MQMKQGDTVYVKRSFEYLERVEVDHTYVSTNGTFCVSLTSGANAPVSEVMTEEQYWARQRAKLEESVQCK